MAYPDQPKSGTLLVAEPFLGDPSFDRSVVLITEHNDEGTVGYVLNRPLSIRIDTAVPDFPSMDAPLYNGGPVQQNNLYFLHKRKDLFPNALDVAPDIYWGGEFDRLKEVAALGLIKPQEIKFFLGYSGWASGQLEGELLEHSWRVLPADTIDIYATGSENMWKTLVEGLGGEYLLWANAPSDPLLN